MIGLRRYLDTDHNGVIDYEEFMAGVGVLNGQVEGPGIDAASARALFKVRQGGASLSRPSNQIPGTML